MSTTWDDITVVDVSKLSAHQREVERWVKWWRDSDRYTVEWEIDDLHAQWRRKAPVDFSQDFSDQPTLPTGRPVVKVSRVREWFSRLLAWEV